MKKRMRHSIDSIVFHLVQGVSFANDNTWRLLLFGRQFRCFGLQKCGLENDHCRDMGMSVA